MSRNTKNAVASTSCVGSTQQHPASNPIFAGQLPPLTLPGSLKDPLGSESEIQREVSAIHATVNDMVCLMGTLDERTASVRRQYPRPEHKPDEETPSSPLAQDLFRIRNRLSSLNSHAQDIINDLAC